MRRGGLRYAVMIGIVAAVACAGAAQAEKRVALVIGNGAYKHAPKLPNPANDAQDVAAALKRTGFDTILALDVEKTGMDDAEIKFARAARDADIALFYYSGHAMQYNGINYLMPVDATLADEADLRRLSRLDDLVADLQQAKNLRVLVLDSCRDNPLADDLKRSIGLSRGVSVQRGLAKIENPLGMIVSYATQAGRTAEDGQGRNSPYTTAFLRHIETQDEIGTIFRRVADDVYKATNSAQLPEVSLSVVGEFYLSGKLEVRVDQSGVGGGGPSGETLKLSEAAQAWAATKDTTSAAVLEDFVRQFGTTVYGSMARARLEELKKVAAIPLDRQAAAPSQDEEVWSVHEVGPWVGSWYLIKRGDGSYVGRGEVSTASGRVTYNVDLIEWEGVVAARRRRSSDGNECNFSGTRNGTLISGQYFCRNGGPYAWSADTKVAATISVGHQLPVPPQAEDVWSVRETGPWTGSWHLTKRGDGLYSGKGQMRAPPSGEVTYALEVIERGGIVAAQRRRSSDGNECNFTGNRNGRTISGEYYCGNGGPYSWSAQTK